MVHQYVQTDRGNNLGSSVVAIVLATAVLRAVATAHTNSDTKSSQLLPVSPAPRSRLVPRYRSRGMPFLRPSRRWRLRLWRLLVQRVNRRIPSVWATAFAQSYLSPAHDLSGVPAAD